MAPLLAACLLGAVAASGGAAVRVRGTSIVGTGTAASSEFLGIPFATAERWAAPVDVSVADLPPEFDARSFGPCCPQVPAVYAPNQAEQCLNLNVFAPRPAPARPAPVLVFIHGGGGTTGCSAQASPALYNGSNLLASSREPAVVVTVNYRLSGLANLFLDGAIPDNLQVRDWTSALRWVARHIGAFGGDPSRVLIFGESGGGNAVQLLATAPAAFGLFHHYLSESGTFPVAPGFQNRSAADAAGRALAGGGLGCAQAAAAGVLACLRNRSAADVQRAAGLAQLAVVVGAEMVAEYPPRSLAAGRVSPSLRTATAGWNDPDNFNICGSAAGREAGSAEAVAYLREQVPGWTGATPGEVDAVLAAYNVSGCTPGGAGGDGACCAVVTAALTDAAMRCPAHRALTAHAAHAPGRQYWYRLNCCPTCPVPDAGMGCVCQHTSELAYVFATVSNYESAAAAPLNCTPEPAFRAFSRQLIDTWVGIAARGSHDGSGAVWPAFGDGSALLYLNEQAAGGPAFVPVAWDAAAHRCELWRQIDAAAATARFG